MLLLLLLFWLLQFFGCCPSLQHAVCYLWNGSTQTTVHAATPRQKLQFQHAIWPVTVCWHQALTPWCQCLKGSHQHTQSFKSLEWLHQWERPWSLCVQISWQTSYHLAIKVVETMWQENSMISLGVGIAESLVCWACCPAWCSIAGSILWASDRGDFSLGDNKGSDSIP